MTTEPQPPNKLIRKCVFWVLLLATLYTGAYLSLVKSGLSIRSGRARALPRYIEHRQSQKVLEVIFWPAYQIDYHVRPSMWQVEFSENPLQMRRAL